jgi:small subunit ribosomal protein S1
MASTDDTWMIEVDGVLVPDYDRTLTDFSEGDVVTGTVVRVDKDEILVDIGYKSEGVIPVAELSIRRSVNPDEEVTIGDEIDALVLQKEDADGRLILSKKRARFEKAWKRIEAAAESGEPVEGHVIEVVKGGLIIDLGVRGFLPASLVDIRRVQDLEEYRDQVLLCKVIELNRSRNNVVLSRRAVLEEERKEARQQILDRLSPGVEVEGQISNIVDFGAFVDLDGIDGLIHISELSWSHVNHPSEVLEIGQRVRVKVLDVDRDRQRISLGLKQTQTDPWQRLMDECSQGDVVAGRITKVVTFGAFAEIVSGVEGLIHISELAEHHVENPREVVQQGQDVNVKIVEIDPERRRLSLSLRRVEPDEPVKHIDMGTPGPAAEPAVPELGLSEEVFADTPAEPEPEAEAEPEAQAPQSEPEAEPAPEAAAEPEPEAAAEPESEPEPEPEPEPEAAAEPEEEAASEPEPEAAVEADAGEGESEPAKE